MSARDGKVTVNPGLESMGWPIGAVLGEMIWQPDVRALTAAIERLATVLEGDSLSVRLDHGSVSIAPRDAGVDAASAARFAATIADDVAEILARRLEAHLGRGGEGTASSPS